MGGHYIVNDRFNKRENFISARCIEKKGYGDVVQHYINGL